MRQKYPLQISCVICDFPPGKYLETLCSMPIIFIEGRMWSHQSLFFFRLRTDRETAMQGSKVGGPVLYKIDPC